MAASDIFVGDNNAVKTERVAVGKNGQGGQDTDVNDVTTSKWTLVEGRARTCKKGSSETTRSGPTKRQNASSKQSSFCRLIR